MSPAAEKLAKHLRAPGLDVSRFDEARDVLLGRLLREPRSIVHEALDELHAEGRLVVRPSPLGAELMRYTVGPAPLELDDEGLEDDAREELNDEGLDDDDGQTVALRRGEGTVIISADPICLGRALARLERA